MADDIPDLSIPGLSTENTLSMSGEMDPTAQKLFADIKLGFEQIGIAAEKSSKRVSRAAKTATDAVKKASKASKEAKSATDAGGDTGINFESIQNQLNEARMLKSVLGSTTSTRLAIERRVNSAIDPRFVPVGNQPRIGKIDQNLRARTQRVLEQAISDSEAMLRELNVSSPEYSKALRQHKYATAELTKLGLSEVKTDASLAAINNARQSKLEKAAESRRKETERRDRERARDEARRVKEEARKAKAENDVLGFDKRIAHAYARYHVMRTFDMVIGAPARRALAVGAETGLGMDQSITDAAITFAGGKSGIGDIKSQLMTKALEVSRKTQFSVEQVGSGFQYMASAGFDVNQSLATMGTVSAFAQAGLFDLQRAAGLLSDTLYSLGQMSGNQAVLGWNIKNLSSGLIQANIMSNATTEQFAEALAGRFAGQLNVMGKGPEEGLGLLSAFAQRGIKGRAAGTQAQIMLRDLARAEMRNRQTWQEQGVSIYDDKGKVKHVADIVESFTEKLKELTPEGRTEFLYSLGLNRSVLASMQLLMGTAPVIRDVEEKIGAAQKDNLVDKVAEQRMDVANRQLGLLFKEFKLFLADLVPDLMHIIKLGRQMVEALGGLPGPAKTAIFAFLGLAGAIGKIGTMVTGWHLAKTTFLGSTRIGDAFPTVGEFARRVTPSLYLPDGGGLTRAGRFLRGGLRGGVGALVGSSAVGLLGGGVGAQVAGGIGGAAIGAEAIPWATSKIGTGLASMGLAAKAGSLLALAGSVAAIAGAGIAGFLGGLKIRGGLARNFGGYARVMNEEDKFTKANLDDLLARMGTKENRAFWDAALADKVARGESITDGQSRTYKDFFGKTTTELMADPAFQKSVELRKAELTASAQQVAYEKMMGEREAFDLALDVAGLRAPSGRVADYNRLGATEDYLQKELNGYTDFMFTGDVSGIPEHLRDFAKELPQVVGKLREMREGAAKAVTALFANANMQFMERPALLKELYMQRGVLEAEYNKGLIGLSPDAANQFKAEKLPELLQVNAQITKLFGDFLEESVIPRFAGANSMDSEEVYTAQIEAITRRELTSQYAGLTTQEILAKIYDHITRVVPLAGDIATGDELVTQSLIFADLTSALQTP